MTPVRAASWVLAVCGLATTASCATAGEHRREHQGNETLRVVNATSSPICELRIAGDREHAWGPNWIEAPIAADAAIDLRVRPDDYMLRATDCRGMTKVVAYRVPVDGDLAVVIHDGYPQRPPASTMAELALPSWRMDERSRRHVGESTSGVPLRVTSRCALDLRFVIGGDPSARSGTPSTLPARARMDYAAPVGTDLWLVDADYNVVARTEFSAQARDVVVASSCDAFVPS